MPTETSDRVPPEAEYKSRSTSSDGLAENRAAIPSVLPRMPRQSTRSLMGFLSRISTSSSGILENTSLGSDIGLHLVHDAENPVADLILVHGLGGSWLKTWSWKHNPEVFWPSWLPDEGGLGRVRIFSFGYNSNFKGASTSLGILDFAKDLLFRMSSYGAEEEKIGRVRIGSSTVTWLGTVC